MPEVTVTVDELLLGPEGSQVEMEEPVAAEPTTVKAEPAATAPGHYIPFEDWDVGPFSRDNREARGHSDPDLSE